MRGLLFLPLFMSLADLSVATVTSRYHTRENIVEKLYRGNLQALQAVLSEEQLPERYLSGRERFYTSLKVKDRVLKFSWNNCGSGSDPVQIKSLEVSPDPIQIPGEITISFDIASSVNVSSPLRAEVEVKKKVGFWWVEVPCMEGFGSCDYDDVCSRMPATCPSIFLQHNIPCNCPIPQGEYALSDVVITAHDIPVPSWLTSGDYKINLTGKQADGTRLVCIELQASLN